MEAATQELEEWVNELRASSLPIVVEGKRDKRALERLGMQRVISLDKPLFAMVEEIAAREEEVVILTDLDRKGKELYGKLKKDFVTHGVRVDNHFREFLQQKTRISHIEGLKTYIDRLMGANLRKSGGVEDTDA